MRFGTILLFIIGSLTFPSAQAATSRAVLLGGSGEAETENFLVQDLRQLHRELSLRGWKVTAAVGSQSNLVGASQPAEIAHMERALENAATHSQAGDQLLIVIHSHGREREASLGQLTHSIVAEDSAPEGGGDLGYDLDRLRPHLLKARAQGAQTAVVDLSCYSGTIHALTQADCTASLAAAEYVSSCSGRPEERLFTSFFFKLPIADVTLEEQFLQAREQDRTSVNLPQIASRLTPGAPGWSRILTEIDPLDVYEDLAQYQTGAPTFRPESLRSLISAEADWKALLPLLTDLTHTRLELEQRMPVLRKHQEGPIRLLPLAERQVPVSPGRLGDWLERMAEAKPTSDIEDRVFHELQARRTHLEPEWAPYVNPYLETKRNYHELREQLAAQAGKVFAWERDYYRKHSRASGRAGACRRFQLGRPIR